MSYLKVEDRSQRQLLPAAVDDYIAEENPVRALDEFVDSLDLGALKFDINHDATTAKGRPGYHPAILLKLYLWGYLNKIHSSRKLERACFRDLEVIWLTHNLRPDHSTIAQFRKDNPKALKNVFKQFNLLCLEVGLFSTELVAIDGTFIKAVNSRDRSFTKAKLQKRIEAVEAIIERWLEKLETTDQSEQGAEPTKRGGDTDALQEKIARMKKRAADYETLLKACEQSDTGQMNLTDPDSRQLKKGDKKTVGYNVQSVVEADNHLIVSCEVTQSPNDTGELNRMAQRAKADLQLPPDAGLTVLADKGYGSSAELGKCAENQTQTCVPLQRKAKPCGDGSMPFEVFEYVQKEDAYRCPAGKLLGRKKDSCPSGGVTYRVYYTAKACRGCAFLEKCTGGKYRKLRINEHQAAIDANLERLAAMPESYGKRRGLVEHPFGTIKACGGGELLCRGLALASAEMAMSSWAYNFKRVLTVLDFAGLREMIRKARRNAYETALKNQIRAVLQKLSGLLEDVKRIQLAA